MLFSQLFGKTLRHAPAEADTISHQLLLRAGMIHQVAAGVYAYLPLGWRVLRKIEDIVRQEMDRAGGQEVMLPVLQPLEMWQDTGRDLAFGKGLFVVTDRRQRKLALGPTHEEVITDLVKHNVQSYRDLPLLPYQIQTKFRDEPRPRGGLLRVREFLMKDLYSFDADQEGLDLSYQKMIQAYQNIYRRCGLSAMMVEADSGAIGGKDSHEFMVIAETGEDQIVYCPQGDYAANLERAAAVKPPREITAPLPVEEISTPGIKTIDELARFLGIPHSQTLKAVFYSADGQLAFVVIRGDIEVNEIKLKNLLGCRELRLATDAEVAAAGLVAGSASPVGLTGVKVIADDSITLGSNFVAGGNKPDFHIRNVNYPRDFKVDVMADIANAQPGWKCPRCEGALQSTRGIEVGHIFKLGTFFSQRMGALFLDRDGAQRPAIMGCYGIGIGRLLAAAVEQNHDERGIIWPMPLAPYHVYICALYVDNQQVLTTAESLYAELEHLGLEVLFDDRGESPGVKFNDADLLGIPLRVTVSPRTVEAGQVEVKRRQEKKAQLVPLEGAARRINELLNAGPD
ncbi:MAG: proline--tRNA ligase [Chloroflexi bacterium]|nr:proline--tRNA ligase [Chloroflexota bacterium]